MLFSQNPFRFERLRSPNLTGVTGSFERLHRRKGYRIQPFRGSWLWTAMMHEQATGILQFIGFHHHLKITESSRTADIAGDSTARQYILALLVLQRQY
jgi:hypothetical protein